MSRSPLAVGILVPLILAFPVRAEGPVIEHVGRACVVAERFPQLEARIADPDSISRARVQFRGEGGPAWYFVEMKRSGAVFTGILPKPKKTLKKLSYYIEVTDREFRANRTQEYTADVVPQAALCADQKMMAGVLTTASVIVGAPAGAAAVPVGFSSSGVVGASTATAAGASTGAAGGGGIGTAATVGIIAGGAALAGVAVAASTGGSDTPTTTAAVAVAVTTTTTTTLAPATTTTTLPPCPGCYAGTWQGVATLTAVANPPTCENRTNNIGRMIVLTPVIFGSDGTITLPQSACPGCNGRVDAAGNVTITLPGDPPGSGLTCPTGQLTGRCTTFTSCAGTGSQGSDQYTFTLTRTGP